MENPVNETEKVETHEVVETADIATQEEPAAETIIETEVVTDLAPAQSIPPAQVEPVKEAKPEQESQTQTSTEAKTEIDTLSKVVSDKDETITGLSNKADGYEAALKQVVADKLAGFSDEVAALLPDGSPVEQLEWLKKAEAAGIQKPATVGSPIPSAATSTGKDAVVYETPIQRMAASFGKQFKK